MRFKQILILFLAVTFVAAFGLAVSPSPSQAVESDTDKISMESAVDDGDTITKAMEEIINAIDPGPQELPGDPGELALRWRNLQGADTSYAIADQIEDNVDTGWDMSYIARPDSSTVEGQDFEQIFREVEMSDGSDLEDYDPADTVSITASDSVVRAVQVMNMSNNYVNIDYDALHENYVEELDPDEEEGEFTVELYYEDGANTAADFDGSQDAVGAGQDGNLVDGEISGWSYGEVKTIYLVVTSDGNVSDQDWIKSRFQVTNNAPTHEGEYPYGDGWERGMPVEEDRFDTQTGWFVTQVLGPDMAIDKQALDVEDWRRRPGDTISYEIAVSNHGGDTATDIEIIDAIPEHTTYYSGEQGEADEFEYADGYDYDDFTGEEPTDGDTDVEMLRWHFHEIGPYGDEDPDFNENVPGNRLVEFTVQIN